MENKRDISKNVESEIIIYQTEDGHTKIDVKFEDETVWLTQAQLCELYQTSKSNISEHIKHIFEEGELEETSVVRKFRTTAADGKKYNTRYIIGKEDVFITVAGTIGRVGKIPPELDGANLTENADRLVFSQLDQNWLIKCLQQMEETHMILMPDLFSFAYVPNWYSQLDMLAEMALPEPWRFKNPIYLTKNPDTPILERYIHAIFKKQLQYTAATDYIRFCGQYWIESKQQAVGAAEEFLDLQLADAKDEVQRTKELLMETGVSEEAILSGGKSLEKKIESEQMDVYLAYLSAMAYQTFAMKRRDMKYVVSALQAAKPMLEISVSDLERDGFLLNTPDGTYYLPEGLEGRRDHSPEDYITKITAAGPGEQGKDLWLDALEDLIEAANGKPLLVAYWFRPGRSLVKRNGMSWKPFMGRTVITAVGQLTRLPSIFISNRVPPTIKRTAPCII